MVVLKFLKWINFWVMLARGRSWWLAVARGRSWWLVVGRGGSSVVLGYIHTGTIWYRYRIGLIFGTKKLTVHTGPVRYRTSFGTCSHGYGIVSFRSISRQNKQKKI